MTPAPEHPRAPLIRLTGLSHHTAPMPVRERVAFRLEDYAVTLRQLVVPGEVDEGVLLSTCNRSELVEVIRPGAPHSPQPGFHRLLHARAGEPVDSYLYSYQGWAAVRHVFRVAASLDSIVVGEAQILGQVHDAWEAAVQAGTTGPVLDRLFNRARHTAKRVRTETGIGESHVSVASVAVELATKIFTSLKGREALLVGAGDTARITLEHMRGAGIGRVWVANRGEERARQLSGGDEAVAPVPLERRHDLLGEVDVVISATAADGYMFTRADLAKAMSRRRRRTILLIDLAVPRDIDPDAGDIEGVFLFNVDDLQEVVRENLATRRREAELAEGIVEEESHRFLSWWASRQAVPTVVALRQHVDAVRKEEEARLLSRLGHLNPKDRALIEAYGAALVNKLLHDPTVALQKTASAEEAARLADAARLLFHLQEEAGSADPDDDPA